MAEKEKTARSRPAKTTGIPSGTVLRLPVIQEASELKILRRSGSRTHHKINRVRFCGKYSVFLCFHRYRPISFQTTDTIKMRRSKSESEPMFNSMVASSGGPRERSGNDSVVEQVVGGASSISVRSSPRVGSTRMLSSEVRPLQTDFAAAGFAPVTRSPQSVASLNNCFSSLNFDVHNDAASWEASAPTFNSHAPVPGGVMRLRPRHQQHYGLASSMTTTGYIPVECSFFVMDPWSRGASGERSMNHDDHGDLPCHILLPEIQ
jgi:hypothetical protein